MKYLLSFLLLLSGFFAGNAQVRGAYTISGDLKPVVELWGYDVDSLNLVFMQGYNRIDSVGFADAKFEFSGRVDSRYVETAYLRIVTPEGGEEDFVMTIPVFLEPGDIRVRCRFLPEDEIFDIVVEGTPSNDLLSKRTSRYLDMTYEMLDIARDTTIADETKMKLIENMYIEQDSLYRYIYRDFRDSPVAPMLAIQQYYGTNSYLEAGEELVRLNEKFPDHPDLHDLESVWLSMPGLRVGDTVPDFTATDKNGLVRRFSELNRETYVLVDFWFSAGSPGLADFKALGKLPATYNGLPLRQVGISTDPSREVWLNSLARHKPPGTQLWDEGHVVSRVFHITSYPTRFLVDPQGKIVAKGDFTELPVPE